MIVEALYSERAQHWDIGFGGFYLELANALEGFAVLTIDSHLKTIESLILCRRDSNSGQLRVRRCDIDKWIAFLFIFSYRISRAFRCDFLESI